jgi:hypothetical protein
MGSLLPGSHILRLPAILPVLAFLVLSPLAFAFSAGGDGGRRSPELPRNSMDDCCLLAETRTRDLLEAVASCHTDRGIRSGSNARQITRTKFCAERSRAISPWSNRAARMLPPARAKGDV